MCDMLFVSVIPQLRQALYSGCDFSLLKGVTLFYCHLFLSATLWSSWTMSLFPPPEAAAHMVWKPEAVNQQTLWSLLDSIVEQMVMQEFLFCLLKTIFWYHQPHSLSLAGRCLAVRLTYGRHSYLRFPLPLSRSKAPLCSYLSHSQLPGRPPRMPCSAPQHLPLMGVKVSGL